MTPIFGDIRVSSIQPIQILDCPITYRITFSRHEHGAPEMVDMTAGVLALAIERLVSAHAQKLGGSPKPLSATMGVLYDQEHVDGVGGFHDPETGMWFECITERRPGDEPKTLISERSLRASGYDVPEFQGTPCPKCFPQEQGK